MKASNIGPSLNIDRRFRSRFLMMLSEQVIVLELPRRHLPLKQNIQLLKGPPPTLRNAKPTPNKANRADPPKQEARLTPPIRLITVQHIRHRNCKYDASHGLHGGSDSDCSTSETGRRNLGDYDEADGPDGHLVNEGPDVH